MVLRYSVSIKTMGMDAGFGMAIGGIGSRVCDLSLCFAGILAILHLRQDGSESNSRSIDIKMGGTVWIEDCDL